MTAQPSGSSPRGGGQPPGTRWFIWLAMATAPLMYGVVLALVLPALEIADGPVVPVWVFGVAAMVMVWVSTLVRRQWGADSGTRGVAAVPPMMIVTWALDESVAVLGLVAVLLGSPLATYVPFGVIALGLLWLHRPQ